MRILHFYKTYYPETMGGVEQVINQLARASMQLGIEIDILSLSAHKKPVTLEVHGHRVHLVPRTFQIASTGFSWSAFSYFKALAQKADVLHYHYPWPFMDFVHFITRVKKPAVVTYHSDIVRQQRLLKLYQPVGHRFLTQVDRIVATSPTYLKSSAWLQRYSNTTMIPIGLDKTTYPSVSFSILERWKEYLPRRFFLFVGVLRYYKGLSVLLEAAQFYDYPIVILGQGPIEADLKAQAARLNLQNVYFLGALSDEDKVALLTLCYAVVFPSNQRSEAFGISLLEGAMYGKPMISCEIGTGTSYINCHEKTGLVVPPNHAVSLGQAMKRLWEDPRLATTFGEAAFARYQALFTADKMAHRYNEIYRTLCR